MCILMHVLLKSSLVGAWWWTGEQYFRKSGTWYGVDKEALVIDVFVSWSVVFTVRERCLYRFRNNLISLSTKMSDSFNNHLMTAHSVPGWSGPGRVPALKMITVWCDNFYHRGAPGARDTYRRGVWLRHGVTKAAWKRRGWNCVVQNERAQVDRGQRKRTPGKGLSIWGR